MDKFAGAASAAQSLKSLFADIAEAIAALPEPGRQEATRRRWRTLIPPLADIIVEADGKSLGG